ENKDLVEQVTFPADFISEGVDQTRGWFYSLLAISTLLKDAHPELGKQRTGEPFKNVIVIEFILDKFGKKMSKHKGNVVDPFEMIGAYGSDPLRWYMLTASSPWTPTRFDEDGLKETLRKYFDTLKNCYNFLALYANIDRVKNSAHDEGVSVEEYLSARADPPERIDCWIVSRYQSLVKSTIREFDDYELTRPLRAISDFVIDDLSNWYVRRNRKRFWRGGSDGGKMRAYLTLHQILQGLSRLTAPATPLISEILYRELTEDTTLQDVPSVHMTSFPSCDETLIDPDLEQVMGLAQRIVSLGRAARISRNMKVRQPLAQMRVALPGKTLFETLSGEFEEIKSELNLKNILPLENIDDYVTYSAKLNFAEAGKKHGSLVKALGAEVEKLDSGSIKTLYSGGSIDFDIDKRRIRLEPSDVLITRSERDGFAVESAGNVTVALTTSLTPELIAEGFARETVNKIQNLRKQAMFEVTDRIVVSIAAGENLTSAARTHEPFIKSETLAEAVEFGGPAEPNGEGRLTQECIINGETATITVCRV
ncbi:MAG: DUF5915 domain-containing protein, partial [Candidatus Zixiibacteriota bacterium]